MHDKEPTDPVHVRSKLMHTEALEEIQKRITKNA